MEQGEAAEYIHFSRVSEKCCLEGILYLGYNNFKRETILWLLTMQKDAFPEI